MENIVNVKIYLKGNKFVVKCRSSHLKGEMIFKNAEMLDDALNNCTDIFPNMEFHIRFSDGALGKYLRDIDSIQPLIDQGFRVVGYAGNTRLIYNGELRELIVVDEHKMIHTFKL